MKNKKISRRQVYSANNKLWDCSFLLLISNWQGVETVLTIFDVFMIYGGLRKLICVGSALSVKLD